MLITKNTAVKTRFEWKLQDLWVGVFWKTSYSGFNGEWTPTMTELWVCLLPCVPLHITIYRNLDTIPF